MTEYTLPPNVKEVVIAMLEIATRCDPDWEAQLRDWAERLTAAPEVEP